MLIKCFVFLSILSLLSGARSSQPQERIVGGHFIPIEYVPWQVSILKDNEQRCGGSILGDRVILTAAHCLVGVSLTQLSVRAGSSHWKKDGQLVKISKSITNNFNLSTIENDIAVLFLESPLEFNDSVQPIALGQETPEAGTMGLATGWGFTLKNAGFSWPILQGVHLTVIDHNKCQKAYGNITIYKDMFCAAAPRRDTCTTDSGGPLISIKNRKLIGIVSFGLDCGNSSFPGVYANVAFFKNWILKTISGNIKI